MQINVRLPRAVFKPRLNNCTENRTQRKKTETETEINKIRNLIKIKIFEC